MPYTRWPDSDWNDEKPINKQQGYCTHTSVLFLTWHRPYLALYEVCYMSEFDLQVLVVLLILAKICSKCSTSMSTILHNHTELSLLSVEMRTSKPPKISACHTGTGPYRQMKMSPSFLGKFGPQPFRVWSDQAVKASLHRCLPTHWHPINLVPKGRAMRKGISTRYVSSLSLTIYLPKDLAVHKPGQAV